MFAAGYDISTNPDPWRFQPHPEVWLLMISLIAGYAYAIKVIGPKVAPVGQAVTRRQVATFSFMITLLWVSIDWPVHDIAEEYLYSVHMIQHMSLTMLVPPLAYMATPEWLFRLLIGEGRPLRTVRFMTKPVFAGVVYNVGIVVSHIPGVVNVSASNGPVHYLVHVLLVTTAFMMWSPIVSPARDWRMSDAGKMLYLFSMSFVTTIPAGWLAFAESPVYKHYDTPVRVGGVNVMSDQQAAGAIMKLGGAVFMWAVIVFIFFRRFMKGFYGQQSYDRVRDIPDAEVTGNEASLSYEDVEEAFRRTKPAPDSPQTPA